MEEADGSSEKNGVFLRGEIEETRARRPKCKMFVHNRPKRFGNVKIENCMSQSVLPPVDSVSNSCSGAVETF